MYVLVGGCPCEVCAVSSVSCVIVRCMSLFVAVVVCAVSLLVVGRRVLFVVGWCCCCPFASCALGVLAVCCLWMLVFVCVRWCCSLRCALRVVRCSLFVVGCSMHVDCCVLRG